MEIKPPAHDLYTAISNSVSAASKNNLSNSPAVDWKISQLLEAIITKITDKQLFLDIQGVKANTLKPADLDLSVGDKLKLQVEQLKPMPQFRIIRFQSPANINITNTPAKNMANETSPIMSLLKDISYVASRPALRPSPLSAETNAAVRDLFKQIPSAFNLKTATKIKEHIHNSGLFIESKIKNEIVSNLQHLQLHKTSNNKATINIRPLLELDLGAQLHRIAALIRTQLSTIKNTSEQANTSVQNKVPAQQPGRIPVEQMNLQNITHRDEAMQTFLRHLESSLNHMQHTQLQTLNESQTGRPLWLMELPIKNGQEIDLFELRITQDESSQTEKEDKKIWSVTLKFDLAGLGKIKAHITMQHDLISAQFYSEKSEVLGLFRDNFDFLRNRLNCNGLNIGTIECARANLGGSTQTNNTSTPGEKS